MSEKPRVVLDCMVYLQAAAREQSPAAACLRLAERRHIRLFISRAIAREVQDVLSRDYIRARFTALTDESVAAFIERLRNASEYIRTVPRHFEYESRDVKDEPYLNLAIETQAHFLVSRDNDLLDLMKWEREEGREFQRRFRWLKIVDPVTFCKRLRRSSLDMEWISVARKLPERAAPVLIVAGQYITIADWNADERRFKMTSREDAALILPQEITHWTPLPELPPERHNDGARELLLGAGVTVESRLPATPVEYSGKVDDKQYYFKARGQRWLLVIADSVEQALDALGADDPLAAADFCCVGRYGVHEFDAGYMSLEQAEEIIRRCVRLWRSARESD